VAGAGTGLRLYARGGDPVWADWAAVAVAAGARLTTGAVPPAGANGDGGTAAVLTSPWDEDAAGAVGRAVAGLAAAGVVLDVWLVCTDPPASLRAAVLAAGGAGCLPRVPAPEWLERVERLAAWHPDPGGPEAAEAAGEAVVGSGPAGGDTPSGPPGSGGRVGRPVAGLIGAAGRVPCRVGAPPGGRAAWRRAASRLRERLADVAAPLRPARRQPRGGAVRAGGMAPREPPPPGTLERVPPPRRPQAWWAWPDPDEPAGVELAVLAATPRAEPTARQVFIAWAARRGRGTALFSVDPDLPGGLLPFPRGPEGGGPAGRGDAGEGPDAAPRAVGAGVALYLASPPPPQLGHVHPLVGRAAGAQAAAVVTFLEVEELEAAGRLIAALRAAGARNVRAWIVGGDPPPRLLRELGVAFGVPCAKALP